MRFDFSPRRLFAPTPEEAAKLNQEIARLIELYQKVDGYSLLQAQRMADTAKQSGTVSSEVKKLNKELQDSIFASDYLFRSFQEQTSELRNQNNTLKIGKSLFSELTDIAQKLTNFQKGYGDLNEKNFKKLQDSLKFQIDNTDKIVNDLGGKNAENRLKEIKTLEEIGDKQGKLNKLQQQKLNNLRKEEDLYQASLDAQANGIPLLEKELSLSKQIYKTREDLGGLTKAAAGVIQQFGGSLAQYLDVSEAIEAVDEYNKKVIQSALEQDSVQQQLKRIEKEKLDLQNDILDSYNIAADLLDIIKTKQTELNTLTQLSANVQALSELPLENSVSSLTQKKSLVQNILGSLDLEKNKQDEIIAKIDRQIALQEKLEQNAVELNQIEEERNSLSVALTDSLISQEQYAEKINELDRKQADITIGNISLQRNLAQASMEVNDVLRDTGELHTKINNKLSTQSSIQSEINNLTAQQDFATQDAQKKEIGLEAALMKKEQEAYDIKQAAIKATSTGLTGFINKFKSLGVLIDNLNFTKVFTDPVVLLTTLVKLGFEANAQVVALGKSFGVSASEAENIRQDVAEFARGTGDTFITTNRLLKAQSELSKELGIAVKFSNEELATFAKLTELTGLSAQEAGKLAAASAAAGMPTEAYTDKIREAAFYAQQATNTHFDSKEILQDVAKLSAGILVKFQGNPKAIGQAVVEARKLGLTLDQIDKVGESLLNWESSIENELKAELLTGREINIERARAAALSGDQLTLTREIANQVGSLEDYQNMNVIAQRSLAEAFGLSRDEMSEMLMKQEAINKFGDEAAKLNKEQLEDMKRQGLSASEYLKKQEQQRAAQDKFQDAMVKLQDIIGNLVAGPVGQLLDALANVVGFVMKIFGNPVVKFFFNIIAKTAELLSDMADSGLGKLVLGFGALALFLPKIVGGFGTIAGNIGGIGSKIKDLGKNLKSAFSLEGIKGYFDKIKQGFIGSKALAEAQAKGLSDKQIAAGFGGKKAKDALAAKTKDKTKELADKTKDKITDKAKETGDKTGKVEGGSDGSKFRDKMKNIAEGIKAFGNGRVILGGLVGLPASAVGLIAMIPGVLGIKAIEIVNGEKFQENMYGIAYGIEAFGNLRVTGGAANLILASIGLTAMIPGTLGALAIQSLINGPKITESLIGLATGLSAMASPTVVAGALALIPASLGLTAMIVGVAGGALLGVAGPLIQRGLISLAVGLTEFGLAAADPLFWIGIGALAAFNVALIPLGYTLNLMAPAIEAFGNVLVKTFSGIATVITAAANGIATIFGSLENVDVAKLLAIGPALIGIGIGLASLGAGGIIGAIGSFLSGDPVEKLNQLAAAGEGLQVTATALQSIAVALLGVSTALTAIDTSKLEALDEFASNRSNESIIGGITDFITAPIKAISEMAGGEKINTGIDLTPMIAAINEVKVAVNNLANRPSVAFIDGKDAFSKDSAERAARNTRKVP